MEYSTRIGILDISDYNKQFRDYVNADLAKVTNDLQLVGLPVVEAKDLLLLTDVSPTPKPTPSPTPSPTLRPVTDAPTEDPTTAPTSQEPTSKPSIAPSAYVSVEPSTPEEPKRKSFALGLSLGLAGAFAVSALAMLYIRQMEKKARKERDDALAQNPTHSTEFQHNNDLGGGGGGDSGGASNACSYPKGGGGGTPGSAVGGDSPFTLELTPNEAQQGHGGGGSEPLRQPPSRTHTLDEISPASSATPGQQQHSTSPHGTLVLSPHVLDRDAESGGGGLAGQGHSYVPSPTIQTYGGEIMESIFAPSQSTSPGGNNNVGAGGAGLTAQSLPSQFPAPRSDEYTPGNRAQSALPMRQDSANYPMHHMGDIMINDECFSSESGASANNEAEFHHQETIDDCWLNPSAFDGSCDELDNYKNQDLETFRNAIEEAVDGAGGMVSLAVTRALTVSEDATFDSLPWAGTQDNGSIEASCLCETYDWLKRHDEHSSLDSINDYFQDILNRIVITVMFGMTSPLQGAQLAHGCAAILGLDLYQQPPTTTLVIMGMRKTNDLAQGHNFIVKAFKQFGDIEEAAIAPNNRGFGFVRFAKPESVQRALKKYREYEIEIQDVSVSIKILKSERTSHGR